MTTSAVARPLTVPSEAAERVRHEVRERLSRGETARIVGAGTWLDAGRPVAADATPLSMAEHAAIVEYNPADLTLTAQAGASLATIALATREHGQWLTLDPFGDDAGTIGATVATASYGPLAHAFGTPRDNVLGVEFVTGDGRVVRGGGRVVKNVAGFDLTRLVTGAWGTLGVITEVTVRLRALPEVDETVWLRPPSGADGVARLLERLRATSIAPIALELRTPPPNIAGVFVVIRLAGNEALVRAQRQALATVGEVLDVHASAREALQRHDDVLHPSASSRIDMAPTVVARLSRRPSHLAETWADAARVAERLTAASLRASAGRGVVRLVGAGTEWTVQHAFETLPRGSDAPRVVFEKLPAPLWPLLAPSAVDDRLSRGVRDAFDPQRILNPGILGE